MHHSAPSSLCYDICYASVLLHTELHINRITQDVLLCLDYLGSAQYLWYSFILHILEYFFLFQGVSV